jgi:cell division protein FtsB
MLLRALIAILLLSALYLQYKYWFSDVGHFRDEVLGEEVTKQTQRLAALEERNRILAAEVRAQKQGHAAVEARARSDLGMIKEGETFYLVDPESK